MESAKQYLEITHQCPVKVSVIGDWVFFTLDDNNPLNPVVGVYPRKENIFFPRGANNYYFGKKIWTQKTLYLKKSGNVRKVVSGHLVVTANPGLNILKVTSYKAKDLEVNLEDLLAHVKMHSMEGTYLLDKLRSWLFDEPRPRVHSIEGYVYVKRLLTILSSVHDTDEATESFNTLVSLCGNTRIFVDHLLLATDTLFVDKTDKFFVDSESPTYWRVDDKEAKLFAAFKAVVDEGQSPKEVAKKGSSEEPKTLKKTRTTKPKVQTVQTFKDRFAKVFNQHATLSDAWHPLHEASLCEMVYMPSTGSKGGCIDTRYYQPDSLGFICFVYTKEGQDVGLVRYMAQGCQVSKAESDAEISEILAKLTKYPAATQDADQVPVLIDGLIVGYVANKDILSAPNLHWTQYTQHTSFGSVINISPNGGILYREVLDSEGNSRPLTIQQQVHQPLIWDKDIFLLRPECLMSTMASSLPFGQHSSAVRVIFPCSQRKSAACANANTNVFYSFTLTNPEAPRIQTYTEKRLAIRDGQNVVVAIMPFHGKNTEDSIVVSKEAVERGDFHTKVIDTHTLCIKAGQHIETPQAIVVGKQVEFGQLLGSVVGRPPILSRVAYAEDEVLDTISHQSTHPGKIIEVRQERHQLQVVIETVCPLMVGDKLTSRYGQKGVVSELVSLMEMPYTADGVRPSLIINPHAFPTRMTLGQMIESILIDMHTIGKGGSLQIDAFQTHTLDPTHDCMRVLYNPKTFQPYTEKVFVGIVYYHTLKHKVDRKIKMRSRYGKRHQLTGQPLGSRKLNGGIRIGEMEMGILKAQRADSVLEEFYDIGDGIDATYCHACARWDYGGLRFDENDGLPTRDFCSETACGPHTRHHVNRASLQLWEEAAAAGIQLRMEMKKK